MPDDSETIRERIQRYRALLALNNDPVARKVLEQLIKEAEAQLRPDPDRRE